MELARLYRMRDKEDGQEDDKNTDGMGGRIETRRVFLFPEMKGWFGWPHLAQGVAVEKHTIQKRTGKETREVMFALTSLPSGTKAKTILDIFRNHWSVENKVHHVLEWNPLTILHRKVGRGSRATRPTRRLPALPGCGAAIFGGIRRVALSLLQRIKGKRTIPDIMRHLHANGRILRLCLENPRIELPCKTPGAFPFSKIMGPIRFPQGEGPPLIRPSACSATRLQDSYSISHSKNTPLNAKSPQTSFGVGSSSPRNQRPTSSVIFPSCSGWRYQRVPFSLRSHCSCLRA